MSSTSFEDCAGPPYEDDVCRIHAARHRADHRSTRRGECRAAHMTCRICILAAIIGTIRSLGTGAQPLPAGFIVTNAAVYTADIPRARVLSTVIEGQEVYRAENWDECNASATRLSGAARSMSE
jgi:hypothetical protein